MSATIAQRSAWDRDRNRMLRCLRQLGEATVADLAQRTGLSSLAIRNYLQVARAKGLVGYFQRKPQDCRTWKGLMPDSQDLIPTLAPEPVPKRIAPTIRIEPIPDAPLKLKKGVDAEDLAWMQRNKPDNAIRALRRVMQERA